jgi:2'-hydroxyisoflavone reductase
VTAVHGDRGNPADLAQLAGREFDLVFDTAYEPSFARASATFLAPNAGHYAYVSSINAFPGWPTLPDYRLDAAWQVDPDPDAADEAPAEVGEAAYGWKKVCAELAVRRAFGADRSTVLRAGCLVGPHDGVGRLPWWLNRVARGGRLLAPGKPTDGIALIDARDLAEFALLRAAGTFEAAAAPGQITRAGFLALAAEVTGAEIDPVWTPDEFLTGRVEPWTELPFWLPQAEAPSLFTHHPEPALAAGLRCRPLAQTLADTWRWMTGLPGGWQPSERTPGLDPHKEAELLAELAG